MLSVASLSFGIFRLTQISQPAAPPLKFEPPPPPRPFYRNFPPALPASMAKLGMSTSCFFEIFGIFVSLVNDGVCQDTYGFDGCPLGTDYPDCPVRIHVD